MTGTPLEGLVDSPRHRALRQALSVVRERVALLEAALDQPFGQFTAAAVWVGPAARRFGDELRHHRQRLRAQARKVVGELEDELRRTPEKVSLVVAREEAARLGQRGGGWSVGPS
ncbi:hypothetical protein [Nonomuraea lactucae]|uniref:hypothetical protein n=1 Tax=Nonomuraea lactucae TaxID=2249762 RepID=UPI000DE4CCBA|nr:hypothetical protein [Nonomuraea lactucae]